MVETTPSFAISVPCLRHQTFLFSIVGLHPPIPQSIPLSLYRSNKQSINQTNNQTNPSTKVTSTTPTPLPALSSVPKYTMPESTYAALPDTVLAYKRSHKLGRFDPTVPETQERQAQEMWKEVEERST